MKKLKTRKYHRLLRRESRYARALESAKDNSQYVQLLEKQSAQRAKLRKKMETKAAKLQKRKKYPDRWAASGDLFA